MKQTHPARVLDCEAVPIRLPNLSLSVIAGGGSRFLPLLFAIKTCSCNAVTLSWGMAGPSLDMEVPLYISSDHFPIVHEAGAVEGLDALSDIAIGTGLSLVIQRLVSLPEEKAVGSDRLKAKAFIES